MLKLYGVPLSPFARKALLALEYKGLEYENVPTFPGDASPEFRAMSPLGKIPILEHDGFTVPDTSVICRYLERIAPEPALYPADPVGLSRSASLDAVLERVRAALFAGAPRLVEGSLAAFQPTDEERLANILDKALPECLAYVESVTPESGYLVGDSLSIADIAVVTCFIQAQYGDFDVDGSAYPKLRHYLDQAYAAPLVVKRLGDEPDFLNRRGRSGTAPPCLRASPRN